MEILKARFRDGETHQPPSLSRNGRHSLRRLIPSAFAGICLLLGALAAHGQEDVKIEPPFNLRWGMSAIELEEALLGANARIVERKKAADGGEVWQVEGIGAAGLDRCVFTLRPGGLGGVELQYRRADWSPATYEEFMRTVRARIEQKHGPGQELTRQQDADGRVRRTLLAYQWQSAGATLGLYYFAAEKEEHIFRTVSLHYTQAAEKKSPRTPPPKAGPAG